MKFVITQLSDASTFGYLPLGHQVSDKGEIILNEMEVMRNPRLSGSVDERAEQLHGKALNRDEALKYINSNKFSLWLKEKQ